MSGRRGNGGNSSRGGRGGNSSNNGRGTGRAVRGRGSGGVGQPAGPGAGNHDVRGVPANPVPVRVSRQELVAIARPGK